MERRLRVSCGDPYIQEALEGQFADRSIAICSHAPFHLIVDRPLGWALLPHPEIDYPKAIILSDNLCPSYQLDLLERQPAALVSAVEDISTALLDQIRTGYSYYPQIKSPLTTSERGTLKLVALGYTNKEIAGSRSAPSKIPWPRFTANSTCARGFKPPITTWATGTLSPRGPSPSIRVL